MTKHMYEGDGENTIAALIVIDDARDGDDDVVADMLPLLKKRGVPTTLTLYHSNKGDYVN
jgi:hypothetical protein